MKDLPSNAFPSPQTSAYAWLMVSMRDWCFCNASSSSSIHVGMAGLSHAPRQPTTWARYWEERQEHTMWLWYMMISQVWSGPYCSSIHVGMAGLSHAPRQPTTWARYWRGETRTHSLDKLIHNLNTTTFLMMSVRQIYTAFEPGWLVFFFPTFFTTKIKSRFMHLATFLSTPVHSLFTPHVNYFITQ